MKKRETSPHSHDDTTKPDTSMVDIVVRITQSEMFGETILISELVNKNFFFLQIFQ